MIITRVQIRFPLKNQKPAVLAVHARFELIPTHRVGSIGPE